MTHTKCSIIGQELQMNGISTYHPFHGLSELKVAVARFMSQVIEGHVSFNPSQIVLTAGTTLALEMLAFCLADPGNTFLVPFPYFPEVNSNGSALLFLAEYEQGVAQAILRELINFKCEPWLSVSEGAKSVVRQMLEPDPKLRLTAVQVLEHPWLQNAKKAPNVPVGDVVKSRLKQFSMMNRFKRKALRVCY